MNDNKNNTCALPTAAYLEQLTHWPVTGPHVMAHYDAQSVIVYQAYRPSIALHALAHGRFGGPDFSFNRMSWVKPNFLWMMYRAGWATKSGQEHVLGIRLKRAFFDELLRTAVASSFDPTAHASREAWQAAVADSDVRLQWDPDHAPDGQALPRRAVQLGLRGETLHRYVLDATLEIVDMTSFVQAQREHVPDHLNRLHTPVEHPYPWPAQDDTR